MIPLVRQSVGLILILVFTSVGALSTFGEAISIDPLNPLGIKADAASCCADMSGSACCCGDDESSSCCDQTGDCPDCSCDVGMVSLTAFLPIQINAFMLHGSEQLALVPDQRPSDAFPSSIDHIPILSIS